MAFSIKITDNNQLNTPSPFPSKHIGELMMAMKLENNVKCFVCLFLATVEIWWCNHICSVDMKSSF